MEIYGMRPNGISIFVLIYVTVNVVVTHDVGINHGDINDENSYHGSDHHEDDVEEETSIVFLHALFEKYGHDTVMPFEGFEHLLESIGLGKISINDHKLDDHYLDTRFRVFHPDHNHTVADGGPGYVKHAKHGHGDQKLGTTHQQGPGSDTLHDNHGHTVLNKNPEQELNTNGENTQNNDRYTKGSHKVKKNRGKNEKKRKRKLDKPKRNNKDREKRGLISPHSVHDVINDTINECLSPIEMLLWSRITYTESLTEDNFLHVCPIIIYQLDLKACRSGNHEEIGVGEVHEADDHDHGTAPRNFWEVPGKVWGYAIAAVTVISLVGILCVAIIPIMQKIFFNHVIQFLVALAIGSLTGDALLHLIPHAMVPHSHEPGTEGDKSAVWKGLAALTGLYIFFIAEKLMEMCTQLKRRKVNSGHAVQENVGDRLSKYDNKQRYSIVMERNVIIEDVSHESLMQKNNTHCENHELEQYDQQSNYDNHSHHSDDHSHGNHDHSHGNHGHSHGNHGHSHEIPSSLPAMAWMVIMGDGLHNFCDGLAIGASFASSVTSGLSTTVAVFCHELPHELGDFAVLLKAGMSAKRAMLYNLLSSLLCLLGMVIGVLIGNVDNVSSWIFCGVGGMFIYISLADMLPEISSANENLSTRCCFLLLHCLGISLGVGIMLVIALYEDQIKISVDG